MRRKLPARSGFTLLELVVVVALIIAASLLVIPKLTSSSGTASDLSAQTSIDSALSASVALLNSTGRFSINPTVLGNSLDPAVTLLPPSTASTGYRQVSAALSLDTSSVAFAVLSSSGTCWLARRSLGSPDGYLASVFGYHPSSTSSTTCTAAGALADLEFVASTSPGGSWGRPVRISS